MHSSSRRASRASLGLLLLAALSVGCRQDMHDQAKYEAFELSTFFADGASARRPPANTIARGQLAIEERFAHRDVAGEWVTELPMPLTPELLDRGRQRFEVFCSPCHDRTGSGRGMIVQRGFKAPPSYHTDRLRQVPIGYLFEVITNGGASMSGYGSQVKPGDRWAIAAWVRVLQASQNVPAAALSAQDLERVETGASLPYPTIPFASGSSDAGHGDAAARGGQDGGEHEP